MRTQPSQLTHPEPVDVFDIPEEFADDDDDAIDAVVNYRGKKIGVKEALAKMAADDSFDTDGSGVDDWDLRQVREWAGSGHSDDSLPEYDPFND